MIGAELLDGSRVELALLGGVGPEEVGEGLLLVDALGRKHWEYPHHPPARQTQLCGVGGVAQPQLRGSKGEDGSTACAVEAHV